MVVRVKPDTGEVGVKQRYRVPNWSEYDRATIWFDDASIRGQWTPPPPVGRGKPGLYSETAIQTCRTIKALFQLPYRATEGLINSVMRLCHRELPVPDHTHMSRRVGECSVKIQCRPRRGPTRVVINSPGLKIFGEGEWAEGGGSDLSIKAGHIMIRHVKQMVYFTAFTMRRLALPSVLMSISITAAALPPDEITTEEMAMIPPYCAYAQTFFGAGRPEGNHWRARLGPSFGAIHHYCWGQINLQRALRSSTPRQKRDYLLGAVIGDYGYVIRHAEKVDRQFVLLPEILTRKGEVELLRGLPRDANRSFSQARSLKPDYWPAYSGWAEYLIKLGKRAEARRIVETGLDNSPNSRTLGELYRLLGGQLPAIAHDVDRNVKENAVPKSGEPPFAEEKVHRKNSSEAPND